MRCLARNDCRLPRGPGTNKRVMPVLIRKDSVRKERSRVAVQQCLRRQSVSKIRLIVFNSSFNSGGRRGIYFKKTNKQISKKSEGLDNLNRGLNDAELLGEKRTSVLL